MTENKRRLARQIRWIVPGGQLMQLETSGSGELVVEVDHGAVIISAKNCLLTEFRPQGVGAEIRKGIDELDITISLMNCRIDWQKV